MSVFRFKEFSISQEKSAMKVGTDAMVLGSLIEVEGKQHCLDIGTGTGVLSLMVAQKNPLIQIQAIEIDTESADEATFNFQNSPWPNRLSVCQKDFRDFNFNQQFDLIISNPPYFENGLLNESVRKAKTRHEESLPLIELFEKVSSLLSSDGHFWLILPFETASKWKKTAEDLQFYCAQEITIYGKPNLPKRMVFCFSKTKFPIEGKSMLIRNEDNSYSDQYREITLDFHGTKL